MMIKKYISILILAIAFSAHAQNDTTIITILQLNDLHAKINRFPQLKHVVDSIRTVRSEVYLFSAGDLFSGNPIVDRHEKKGWPIIDLMNDLKFDVSALGNHDFDYGQAILNERVADAHFPFICANLNSKNAVFDQPQAMQIFTTKSGLKISVVALLQIGQNGMPDSHPLNFENIQFSDPCKLIKTYKKKMKKTDFQIALTHLGDKIDRQIAEENPWLDLIIGGHSHTKMEPAQEVGHVLITQAGHYVEYLGVNTIKFFKGKFLSIDNVLIPLKNKEEDSLLHEKVKLLANNPAFQKEIAFLPYSIETSEDIGQMMADAYKEGLNVDIAFQNIGGVRINKIEEGLFKLIDVMYLDPFNNEIMLFDMNYRDLMSFLNYAFTVKHKNNQLISGMKVEFITNEMDELVDLKLFDTKGNPLDETKIYKVAINSYMANSYDFSVKKSVQYTGILSNDLIIQYFQKHFPIRGE